MRKIDLLELFETELGLINNGIEKPLTADSEYFLNSGVNLFYKTRYSGMNSKQDGFEQTQKRTDDLRTLVETLTYELGQTITKINNTLYTVILPEDYVFLLGDSAGIAPIDGTVNECWPVDENGNYVVKSSDTIEGTIDTIDRIKENSLSEYHLHYTTAKPIKLIKGNQIYLHTDGNYQVSKYSIFYLRYPAKIDLSTDMYAEYTDMPEHTLSEIVRLAARLYMLNKADVRYETQRSETDVME